MRNQPEMATSLPDLLYECVRRMNEKTAVILNRMLIIFKVFDLK